MIPKSPAIVKSFRIREARLSLNGSHCMTLSPFVVAATPQETLDRLEVFSQEVRDVAHALYHIAEKPVLQDPDRQKSVQAIVANYSSVTDMAVLETKLNKAFLESTGVVQKTLVSLENQIVQERNVPADMMNAALSQITRLGHFLDAVPQVYQRSL